MVNIEIEVTGTSIAVKTNEKITSGMVGAIFSATYDDSWADLEKKVIFKADQLTRIADGNVVPFEVLRLPDKTLFVGVEGKNADGNVIIPTVWACVGKILSGANGEIPASTSPVIDGGGSTGGGGGFSGGDLDMEGNDIVNAENIRATDIRTGAVRLGSENAGVVLIADGNAVLGFYGDYGDEHTILRNIAPGIQADDAVTKGQLDEAIGDIETVLDSIISIQNNLIGGNSV